MFKKGQADMFGLIIIMVILILALLFFVKTRQEESSNVVIRSSVRANSLLNAIVNYNADVDIKNGLKECLEVGAVDCGPVKGRIKDILGAPGVLLPNEEYKFEASGDGDSFDVLNSNCDEGITASPIRWPGNYVFKLKLCSK